MARSRPGWGLLLGVMLAATGAQGQSSEGRATFHVTNDTDERIAFGVFSKSRAHSWPAHDRHWPLTQRGFKYTIAISCRIGEKLCYGGWVDAQNENGPSWGVGYGARQGCENCCTTCGSVAADVSMTRRLTD